MKYRLASAPALYAPGFIQWAVNGAKFANDRAQMAKIISDGWNVPLEAARKLVCAEVPFIVDGETVEFEA